jgi:hypothetical protein
MFKETILGIAACCISNNADLVVARAFTGLYVLLVDEVELSWG